MNKNQLLVIVVCFVLIFSGCSKTVTAEDVYHSIDVDSGLSGAKNITVELSKNGMIVRGSEISVLARITQNSFAIDTVPEDIELAYTIENIALNPSGSMVMKANLVLGPDSSLPAFLPMQGGMIFVPKDYGFVPGAVDSQNITVNFDPKYGAPEVGGLKFRKDVVLNIWEDGIIEVDKEDVIAIDQGGFEWISKLVNFEGKEVILIVRH